MIRVNGRIRFAMYFAVVAVWSANVVTACAQQLLNLPKPPGGLRYSSFAELDKKWPTTHGEGSVCLWGDDKNAAVSFTIDDNIPGDIPFWQQASADYGWKFTWFIIVYPYMWDVYNNTAGTSTGFGTAAQYKVLYDQGHEIELHGATGSLNVLNTNDYREQLVLTKNYLESIISNNITTFAYPSGEVDPGDGSRCFEDVVKTMFIAARGTTGGSTPPATVNYTETLSMGTALLPGSESRWAALEDKTNKVISSSSYRGWAVILNHTVQDKPATIALFDYIKTNEFKYWVKPFSYVARYAQERESSTLNITQVGSNQISFTLTDQMDDRIFNVPLTVKFCVNGWGGVHAVQNGQPVAARLITSNNITYALVEAVPDQGVVTLSSFDSAGFTAEPTSGWVPLTVSFTDVSTFAGITNRFWDFGDGATTNTDGTTVSHTYYTAGTSTVQLIISGPDGVKTNTQAGLIHTELLVAPSAGFNVSTASGSVPLTVTFTDISTGTITNRFWDFGDGFSTNTTATGIVHTYNATGTNTVRLIVSGPAGASTNIQIAAVTVTEPAVPVANFTAAASGTVWVSVSFTDTSTGTITNRFWNFGDGVTINTTATSVAHTYATAGTNTVQLIVSGSSGASTNTQTIIITAASASPGDQVHLNISSAFNYDAVVTAEEILNAGVQTVKTAIGDHALTTSSTAYSFAYNPNGASNKGLPTDGLVDGGKYEFAAGLVGAAKYGTVDGTAKVNNSVSTKGFNNAWVTVTLPVDQQQKYSDFNVLMSGRRYASTKTVTLTANLEYKYVEDAAWYSVINESVSLAASGAAKGATFGGFVSSSSTAPATDGVWSPVTMGAAGAATGSGPTAFAATQYYAFELTTPVVLDNAKTLEAIRIRTGTSNTSYFNEGLLYALTATLAGAPAPGGNDDDSDGLPNDWEVQYFGNATNANPGASAANGVNTLLEAYIAGLDPTNARSVFTVSNGVNTLKWNAASGRVYSIYRSTNLLNGFQPLVTNIVWPQNSWTGQVNESRADFYEVKVQLSD